MNNFAIEQSNCFGDAVLKNERRVYRALRSSSEVLCSETDWVGHSPYRLMTVSYLLNLFETQILHLQNRNEKYFLHHVIIMVQPVMHAEFLQHQQNIGST